MNKTIAWFEIPALDLDRARAFYQNILGATLREESIGTNRLCVFPYDRQLATGGCIIAGPGFEPSNAGVLVYLNAGDNLDGVLERIHPSGGTIVMPRTTLPPGMGAIAWIIDSEGNRVGLHSA